jgi:hypothetical protein
MTKRKVVQIAAAPYGEATDFGPRLFALCDDGTVWSLGETWRRIQPIPQPPPPPHAEMPTAYRWDDPDD